MSDWNSKSDDELIALISDGSGTSAPWAELDEFLDEKNIDNGPYLTYIKYIYYEYHLWCIENNKKRMSILDFRHNIKDRFDKYYQYICINNKDVAWVRFDKRKEQLVEQLIQQEFLERRPEQLKKRKKKSKKKRLKYIDGILLDLPD